MHTGEMRIGIGDIVQHFKREVNNEGNQYLYRVVAFAEHTETKEKLVVYQALYPQNGEFKTYCRPYDMFMSEVDKDKYPDIKQTYRLEKWNGK